MDLTLRSDFSDLEITIYTSAPLDNNWIQPSAAQAGCVLQTKLIDNIYAASLTPADISPLPANLFSEFQAWEIASDQDLINFENNLPDE